VGARKKAGRVKKRCVVVLARPEQKGVAERNELVEARGRDDAQASLEEGTRW
jgi:hypothetical protein